MTKEERIAKAVALFKEGYNCSQSVVGAYADLYGFTPEQAFRMSASFGAGIGRMRMTCGVGADRASKSANYALVQELAAKFKEQTGTLVCAELLGLSKKDPISAVPEERTPQYYAKRPCPRMIELGARIFGDFLEEEGKLVK